ncbi:CHC2 zinc finger domain-containing protein [Aeromonas veronii]
MSQSTQFDLEFALADAGHSLTLDFAAIKEQFPIMDVTSALTGQDVKKVGSNTYRLDDASCPLCGHNDCFTLYPDDDKFHCYSCEERGDVFELIVKCGQADKASDAARLLLLGG